MKMVTILLCFGLFCSFLSAEEIQVYPPGVTEKTIKMHGRARTRAMIHLRIKSPVFMKMSEEEKNKIRREALRRKHDWSTSKRPPRHKKNRSIKQVRCNSGIGKEMKVPLKETTKVQSAKCKTKF